MHQRKFTKHHKQDRSLSAYIKKNFPTEALLMPSRDHNLLNIKLCVLNKAVEYLEKYRKYSSLISYPIMMTSSNGNIFRVTGHLCGEFTGHR